MFLRKLKKNLASGYRKDLIGQKIANVNANEDTFNNLIGNKPQNFDEELDNPYKKIKFDDQKASDSNHSKLIDNAKKEEVNDKYHKFEDRT